jgi:hypothetical protein
VIIAFAALATQDVGDEREACLALRGELDGILDLGLRGALCALFLALCALGAELLGDLVRVEGASLCAVGLVDVVLGGRVCDAEDLVEGGGGVSLVGGDLVADAEDFAIWERWSVLSDSKFDLGTVRGIVSVVGWTLSTDLGERPGWSLESAIWDTRSWCRTDLLWSRQQRRG